MKVFSFLAIALAIGAAAAVYAGLPDIALAGNAMHGTLTHGAFDATMVGEKGGSLLDLIRWILCHFFGICRNV
jgi:hypothetical protein